MTDQPPLFDLPPLRVVPKGDRLTREFVLLGQSRDAIGVSRDGTADKSPANTAWLPKAEIEWDIHGTAVLVDLPPWLAKKEGLTE